MSLLSSLKDLRPFVSYPLEVPLLKLLLLNKRKKRNLQMLLLPLR